MGHSESLSRFGEVDIIVCPQADPYSLLPEWAEHHGYRLHACSGGGAALRRAWNHLVAKGKTVVAVDYPIDTEEDVNTVSAFVESVVRVAGAHYYAPRPNDYVSVQSASLIGMREARIAGRAKTRLIEQIKPVVKRAIAVMPEFLREHAARTARKVYAKLARGGETRFAGQEGKSRKANFAPEVQTPEGLRAWDFDWTPWKPSVRSLRRDLLDRIDRFFPYPLSFHVIVLNKCNLACVMCPYHSPLYRAGHTSGYFDEYRSMKLDTFRRLAEYAGKRGISFQFGQIEEAMMHKKIFDFIEIATQSGIPHIHLTTNGTLLTRQKAERLAKSGINSVMFSVDSINPETYRRIRGGDLQALEENIRYFIPLARRAGINVMTSFILQPQSDGERDAFMEKWRRIGVNQVTFYVLTEHDPKTGNMMRSQEMYDKGKRYPCASPWIQSVVFPDGEISLCCKTMTDVGWRGVVSVGNINERPFEQIWIGDRYNRVRKELLRNSFEEFDVCRSCKIWSATTYLVEEGKGYSRTFNETMETYQFQ